jgi:hypothetical protein
MQTGMAAAAAGDGGWVTTVTGRGKGVLRSIQAVRQGVERGEGLLSRSGPTALNDPGEREKES